MTTSTRADQSTPFAPPAPADAREARSGLAPWVRAELPVPPHPRGLGWLAAVGPGVIVLGISIGSGEFLLGPAAFVRHGLALLWVTGVAIFFQTIFNLEVMRYTVATGEPVFTGFMRTRPSATLWAWVYALLYFLQVGWPSWAGTAAGAFFFLGAKRVVGPGDELAVYLVGVGTFIACVLVLLVGRRIARTLEVLNWVMVSAILGSFLALALLYVPGHAWLAALAGLAGYDVATGSFSLLPRGADYVLLAALVAFSGCGGVGNLVLSNWARDKGYGMGARVGHIPGAVGGHRTALASTGFTFAPDAEGMRRWRGWWRIVRADQWGVFFAGALLGMVLPALLYVTFLPRGTEIRGLGISAALAFRVGARAGPLMAGAVAFLGAWLLFKTQLDQLEGMVRALTDMLWTGSRRVRAWRGGDVRAVYYSVLAALVLWGVLSLRLAAPIVLLQVAANVAGFVFVVAAPHLLWVNTRLLPPALRPPMWRRVTLVLMALFYATFTALSVASLL